MSGRRSRKEEAKGIRTLSKERLQKVLAHAGIASRRESEKIIQAGRVQVDGVTVRTLGTRVNPHTQTIAVDGKIVQLERNAVYMFNKPTNVITTLHDPQGRRTVAHYLQHVKERVYPVGRLDRQTTGLLLLTNDGELSYRLTHPKFEVKKEYIARVRGRVSQAKAKQLAAGVQLDDGPTAPAEARIENVQGNETTLRITIHEGRKRQVRRMCAFIGHDVIHLHRTKFANLQLQSLQPGQLRRLGRDEWQQLRKHVGLITTAKG